MRTLVVSFLLLALLPAMPGVSFSSNGVVKPTRVIWEGRAEELLSNDYNTVGENIKSFTENKGQIANNNIIYYSIDGNFNIGFEEGSVMYLLLGERGGWAYRMAFNGSKSVKPVGENPVPYYTNYFYGNDESQWISHVRHYTRITYYNLYPNVDLTFFVKEGGLKYNFIVHPGGSPESIRITYFGAEPRINSRGELKINTPAGTVYEDAPVSFQGGRVLKTQWVEHSSNTFGFRIDEWDEGETLIIDPVVFSTFLGDYYNDFGKGVAVDGSGYVYVTGITSSPSFPTTVGSYDNTSNGYDDVFVTKMNVTGDRLIFSTFVGGSNSDEGHDLALDSDGNIYVTGLTYSSNFPTTPNAYMRSWGGGSTDGFVFKLNASGDRLIFSTYIGGLGYEWVYGIDVDSRGCAYITGHTTSQNFPTTSGAYSTTHNGGWTDSFVVKLNRTGGALVFSTFLGGSGGDNGWGIAVSPSFYVFVSGTTYSSNFPTTSGAFDRTLGGNRDAYVAKLNVSGDRLIYSTYIGGGSVDRGLGIEVDALGYAYLTGTTDSSNFPTTPGAFMENTTGVSDAYAVKLNISGDKLIYSTFIGGRSSDSGVDTRIDTSGNAYVVGYTQSTDFPTTPNANDTTFGGYEDCFLSVLNSSGTGLLYSSFIGGSSGERPNSVGLNNLGFVAVTGNTRSTDFPTTTGCYDSTYCRWDDAFVYKYSFQYYSPKNLTYTSGYFWVNLSWEHPPEKVMSKYNLTNYTIYRAVPGGRFIIRHVQGNTTWYNDTIGTFAYDEYYYMVTATFENLGESPPSNVVIATVKLTPPIKNITAVPGDLCVNLTWMPPPSFVYTLFHLVNYTIYRGDAPNNITPIAILGNVSQYTDRSVPPVPKGWYYAITYTLEGIGESRLSNTTYAMPRTPPAPPIEIRLERGRENATLTWSPPEKNGGYPLLNFIVYRGNHYSTMVRWAMLRNGTLKFIDNGLIPGRVYFYAVSAVNRLGEGLLSDYAFVKAVSIPSSPTNFRAQSHRNNVDLLWDPPLLTWGVGIEEYRLYKGDSPGTLTLYKTLSSGARTFSEYSPPGHTIYYAISAVNVYGESALAGPISARPTTLPGKISWFTVRSSDSMAILSWGPVEDDGGSPIMSYKIYRGMDYKHPEFLLELPAGVNRYTDKGLRNGMRYYYWISGSNKNGEGPLYGPIMAAPGAVPGLVKDLKAEQQAYSVTLLWNEPNTTGGRPITKYIIYRGESPYSATVYAVVNKSDELIYTDRNVRRGVEYFYAVSVLNEIGEGPLSGFVSCQGAFPPNPPIITKAIGYQSSLEISWEPPKDTGGATIISYKVYWKSTSEYSWNTVETQYTAITIGELIEGRTYEVKIRAVNQFLEGNDTNVVKVDVGGLPPRLEVDDALAGNHSITLSWSPPSLGHLPILVYRIYLGERSDRLYFYAEIPREITRYTIRGLINGIRCYVQISAVNRKGEGPRSRVVSAVPISEPGGIEYLWVVEASDGKVVLRWTPPLEKGGEAEIKYRIYRGESPGAEKIQDTVSGMEVYMDTHVTNGRTYYYYVRALNSIGEGERSPRVEATPVGPPSKPLNFRIETHADHVILSWGPPGDDGGDAIAGYIIFRGRSPDNLEVYAITDADTTMFTDKNVIPGRYYYKVIAFNAYSLGEQVSDVGDVPSERGKVSTISAVLFVMPVIVAITLVIISKTMIKGKEDTAKEEIPPTEKKVSLPMLTPPVQAPITPLPPPPSPPEKSLPAPEEETEEAIEKEESDNLHEELKESEGKTTDEGKETQEVSDGKAEEVKYIPPEEKD